MSSSQVNEETNVSRSASNTSKCSSTRFKENPKTALIDIHAELARISQDLSKAENKELEGKCGEAVLSLKCVDRRIRALLNTDPPIPTEDLESTFGVGVKLEGAAEEREEVQKKLESMRTEWYMQEEHMVKIAKQLADAEKEIELQSDFCTHQGLVLSKLLWKVTTLNHQVEFITTKCARNLEELLKVMDGCLYGFTKTYSGDIPNPEAEECQLIVALCGVLTNISSVPDGRHFLMSRDNSLTLYDFMIGTLPSLFSGQLDDLRWLILVSIYNIMVNPSGIKYASKQKSLPPALSTCLAPGNSPKIMGTALRIAKCLVDQIKDCDSFFCLMQELPAQRIVDLTHDKRSFISTLASTVLAGMGKAFDALKACMKARASRSKPKVRGPIPKERKSRIILRVRPKSGQTRIERTTSMSRTRSSRTTCQASTSAPSSSSRTVLRVKKRSGGSSGPVKVRVRRSISGINRTTSMGGMRTPSSTCPRSSASRSTSEPAAKVRRGAEKPASRSGRATSTTSLAESELACSCAVKKSSSGPETTVVHKRKSCVPSTCSKMHLSSASAPLTSEGNREANIKDSSIPLACKKPCANINKAQELPLCGDVKCKSVKKSTAPVTTIMPPDEKQWSSDALTDHATQSCPPSCPTNSVESVSPPHSPDCSCTSCASGPTDASRPLSINTNVIVAELSNLDVDSFLRPSYSGTGIPFKDGTKSPIQIRHRYELRELRDGSATRRTVVKTGSRGRNLDESDRKPSKHSMERTVSPSSDKGLRQRRSSASKKVKRVSLSEDVIKEER